MNYNELVKHYGGLTKAAQALGFKNKQTVHAWKERRRIPTRWQLLIESETGLRADQQARDEALELMTFYMRGRRGIPNKKGVAQSRAATAPAAAKRKVRDGRARVAKHR